MTHCNLNGVGLIRENGRDSARVSFGADWSREVITDGGLVLRGFADARVDYYQKGALDAANRGDHDMAAIYREKADRYAR